jgi:hypothetical protein
VYLRDVRVEVTLEPLLPDLAAHHREGHCARGREGKQQGKTEPEPEAQQVVAGA